MDNIGYYLLTYYAFLIKWASIRNHRRNGKFGWYAMGAARNTYLGLDCGLSNHLERTSFFWKGKFGIRSKRLVMLIIIPILLIFHCKSTISSFSFHMIDYLVHRPVSIFRYVRAIGTVGNITRCFYRTLEGKLIIVK